MRRRCERSVSAQMTRNADVFYPKTHEVAEQKPIALMISAQACINMTGAFFNLAL